MLSICGRVVACVCASVTPPMRRSARGDLMRPLPGAEPALTAPDQPIPVPANVAASLQLAIEELHAPPCKSTHVPPTGPQPPRTAHAHTHIHTSFDASL